MSIILLVLTLTLTEFVKYFDNFTTMTKLLFFAYLEDF
jgi:hypothetical protein